MDETVPLVAESAIPSDTQGLPTTSTTTTAAGSISQGAPIATAIAADDILLRRHFPAYYFDGNETIFPIDLNRYIAGKREEARGCNGVVTKSASGQTWLIYMNYYLMDGGVKVCCNTVGAHDYDLEIVIVELSSSQAVTGVFYGPHSGFEHFWVRDPEDIADIMENGLHPRVYISNGKHASYPVAGQVYRLFGFGTDKCENPVRAELELFPLDEDIKVVDIIDGVFQGPAPRIARDWSVAPESRLSDIKHRRFLPPLAQVSRELGNVAGRCRCWA